MIGGRDVRIPTELGHQAVEIAVRAIGRNWPEAVFETATTADRYDHAEEIPFSGLDEIFVYRDAQYRDAWDLEGATPELTNTMIHILHDSCLISEGFRDVVDSCRRPA